jgi:hypothetical protein
VMRHWVSTNRLDMRISSRLPSSLRRGGWHSSGSGIRSFILAALVFLLSGTASLWGQEGRPEDAGAGQGAASGPVRISRPANLRSPFASGADPSGSPQSSTASAGWWLGSAGIALALAVCGAVCVAARKYLPQPSSGLVHVVGRVSLSSRHSIFLVRAGQRTLLIGTGAQGAPALLGELGEDECLDGPLTGASGRRAAPRLDVRLGEDE